MSTKHSLLTTRDYYKPFQYAFAFKAYEQMQEMHWLPSEVPLHDDVADWNGKLSETEKNLLTQLFRFFTQADCFSDDTEILTSKGWKNFSEITKDDKVAQVNEDNTVTFVVPTHVISKDYNGKMLHFYSERKAVDFLVTPNHRIPYEYKGKKKIDVAKDIKLYQGKTLRITTNGLLENEWEELTPLQRISIAHQADGNTKNDITGEKIGGYKHRFSFTKERKIARFREILVSSGLNYEEIKEERKTGNYITFSIILPEKLSKSFEWVDLDKISPLWAKQFIEEVSNWDSHVDSYGRIHYTNTNKEAADVVQTVAMLGGIEATIYHRTDNRSDKFNDTFKMSIGNKKTLDGQHVIKNEVDYKGKVYCVTVPSGEILVRRNGKPVVSGNCDVAGGYRTRYMPAFGGHPEVAMMLWSFGVSEANHVHAYSQLLDTIGMAEVEYKAFQEFAEMKEKHEYLFGERVEKLSKKEALALDLAIFSAFGEGMQLFSSFAMLLSFPKRGLMKGMGTIVEWSIKDESHHVEYMTKLFRTFIEENPKIWTDEFKKLIYQACRDMVILEDKFIDLAFAQGAVEGLNADEVKKYVRYIADRRLNQLGLKGNYGVIKNPFPWLGEMLALPVHTNFFEGRGTEYNKGGIDGWDEVFTTGVSK